MEAKLVEMLYVYMSLSAKGDFLFLSQVKTQEHLITLFRGL